MYRGFQLTNESVEACHDSNICGLARYACLPTQNTIQDTLQRIIKEIKKGKIINATQLQNNWFPEISADIFISHRHSDYKVARKLSTWLCQTFGLKTFIDSDLWGCVNDFLKQIDDEICYDNKRKFYDYNKRNFSTAHVHAMLSNALIKMIDETECLFFLNTPNSIHVKNTVEQTESPWLYLELMAS